MKNSDSKNSVFVENITKPKVKQLGLVSTSKMVDILGPTIVTKVATQAFYETLCTSWYESGSKLWNFTINPDPKKCSCIQSKGCEYFGKLKDSLIKKRISEYITTFFNSKKMHGVVREAVLYWEYGNKSGKFHCNCTILVNSDTDDKTRFLIEHHFEDYFGNNRAVYFKDGRKFKSEDIYNCKDAGFMAKCGHKPLYLTHNSIFKEGAYASETYV